MGRNDFFDFQYEFKPTKGAPRVIKIFGAIPIAQLIGTLFKFRLETPIS